MPRIGNYKYPQNSLTTILADLKKCYTALQKGITPEGLASALGMKWSGTSIQKVADMRAYGLIEGRGNLKLTDLGVKVLGYREDERRRAREEAWLNISALELMHELFSGSIPKSESEFFAILHEKTQETRREKFPDKARAVKSLYEEALSDLQVESVPSRIGEVQNSLIASDETSIQPKLPAPTVPEKVSYVEIKAAGFYQRLPYTVEGIEIATEFLNLLKTQLESQDEQDKS